MEQALRPTPARYRTVELTYHIFDYNLDFFEVGTIDDDVEGRG